MGWFSIEFGGLVFWILFGVLMLAELLRVRRRNLRIAGWPVVLLVLLLCAGGHSAAVWVQANWVLLLYYLPVGMAWAVVKWTLFARSRPGSITR